jgi:hypothetical protein
MASLSSPTTIVPLLTFAITFQCYLLTLSPTIPGGDSGELVAEGCALGTAHPPGYPLYTVVTYLVSSAPFLASLGSIAYRMNVVCALFGAITASLISHLVLLLTSTTSNGTSNGASFCASSSALLVGLVSSFSPLAWQYHVTSEVFALNNLLTTATLTSFMHYVRSCQREASSSISSDTEKHIYIGALMCSLALTNQHTSILLTVPAVLYIIHSSRLLDRNPLILLKAALLVLLPLSLYALLPYWASNRPHPGAWGDVTSLLGFLNHFRRKDYGTFQLYSGDASTSEGLASRLGYYLNDLVNTQGGFLTLITAVVAVGGGFVDCFKRDKIRTKNKKEIKKGNQKAVDPSNPSDPTPQADIASLNITGIQTLLLLLLLTFYLLVFHTLANLPLHNPLLYGVHARFWMQPNIIVFVLSGVGLTRLHRYANQANPLYSNALMALTGGILLHSLLKTYPAMDQSDNVYFEGYAKAILQSLPPSSLLFINYDQQWTSIRYFQECEGVRPDVTSINLSMMSYLWWPSKHKDYPHMTFPGSNYVMPQSEGKAAGGFTFYELLNDNADNFPGGIYIGGKLNYGETDYMEKWDTQPHGLVTKFVKRENSKIHRRWLKKQSKLWHDITSKSLTSLPDLHKYKDDTWEWTIHREYFDHLADWSSFMLDRVTGASNELAGQERMDVLVLTAAVMEFILKHDDFAREKSYATYKNLGLAYMTMIREQKEDVMDTSVFVSVLQYEGMDGMATLEGSFVPVGTGAEEWKAFATNRWAELWQKFLTTPGAEDDPSYASIKNIVEQVFASAAQQQRKN